MLPTTRDALKSVLTTDPTVSAHDRNRMLRALRDVQNVELSTASNEPRIVRRRDVARMLSCSLRTVDNLAAEGRLPRVSIPGRTRALGFRVRDVEFLVEGGAGQ